MRYRRRAACAAMGPVRRPTRRRAPRGRRGRRAGCAAVAPVRRAGRRRLRRAPRRRRGRRAVCAAVAPVRRPGRRRLRRAPRRRRGLLRKWEPSPPPRCATRALPRRAAPGSRAISPQARRLHARIRRVSVAPARAFGMPGPRRGPSPGEKSDGRYLSRQRAAWGWRGLAGLAPALGFTRRREGAKTHRRAQLPPSLRRFMLID